MKRLLVVAFLALAASVVSSPQASADYPANLGYLPFGFYQPYGARYGTSLRTPPHFALNPPVYYGARHARPYGLSPFSSPPLVQPSEGYRSRLRSKFSAPPARPSAPPQPSTLCNPCVSHSKTIQPVDNDLVVGKIRNNPFIDSGERIAQN